jgi:hypothetical protein
MAKYRQLLIEGEEGLFVCTHSNIFEAVKLAFYMYKFPEKVGALMCPDRKFVFDNFILENDDLQKP